MKKDKRRPVIRVDIRTKEVVRFPSVVEARDSIGWGSISSALLTNCVCKGYRFYYEEDYEGEL